MALGGLALADRMAMSGLAVLEVSGLAGGGEGVEAAVVAMTACRLGNRGLLSSRRGESLSPSEASLQEKFQNCGDFVWIEEHQNWIACSNSEIFDSTLVQG